MLVVVGINSVDHFRNSLKLFLNSVKSHARMLYANQLIIVGKPEFSDHLSKLVICHKRKGYNIHVIK